MAEPNNWNGRDPRLRTLRTIAVGVLLMLASAVVLDYIMSHRIDLGLLGMLLGSLLVLLGFESGVRFTPGGR